MPMTARVAGRFARDALAAGEGVCRAVFRGSFYLDCGGGRYVCVAEAALGRGPLNALVSDFTLPKLEDRVAVAIDSAQVWTPPRATGTLALDRLHREAAKRIPAEGLGCLIVGAHNSLSGHLQPALDALGRWLIGNALAEEAGMLIGAGPGLTPAGDDYLGGVLIALHAQARGSQAESLWRWLKPRLNRTSVLSAAYLAAAAAGEGHEALHAIMNGSLDLDALDAAGHAPAWDALAGIVAVEVAT